MDVSRSSGIFATATRTSKSFAKVSKVAPARYWWNRFVTTAAVRHPLARHISSENIAFSRVDVLDSSRTHLNLGATVAVSSSVSTHPPPESSRDRSGSPYRSRVASGLRSTALRPTLLGAPRGRPLLRHGPVVHPVSMSVTASFAIASASVMSGDASLPAAPERMDSSASGAEELHPEVHAGHQGERGHAAVLQRVPQHDGGVHRSEFARVRGAGRLERAHVARRLVSQIHDARREQLLLSRDRALNREPMTRARGEPDPQRPQRHGLERRARPRTCTHRARAEVGGVRRFDAIFFAPDVLNTEPGQPVTTPCARAARRPAGRDGIRYELVSSFSTTFPGLPWFASSLFLSRLVSVRSPLLGILRAMAPHPGYMAHSFSGSLAS